MSCPRNIPSIKLFAQTFLSNSPKFVLFLSLPHSFIFKVLEYWGTWVAQSLKRLTSAQVMISLFVSLIPTSSCVPGACFRFCVSLSLCPFPAHGLSLKNEQTFKKNFKKVLEYLLSKSMCLNYILSGVAHCCCVCLDSLQDANPIEQGSISYTPGFLKL